MLREKIKEVEIMKKYLIVFLISMVPLIELRGAIRKKGTFMGKG